MRDARVKDHWRRASTRTYPTRLDSITFEALSCLADGAVTFSSGITAIVGGNGVGKSTLIAAVAELLSVSNEGPAGGQFGRLTGSKTGGVAFENSVETHLGFGNDASEGRMPLGPTFRGECQWLDPSAFAQHCVKQIRRDSNFDDLLEQVAPIVLTPEEVELASYVVGKEYTACSISEISEYGELDTFPYFEVTSCGATYGSENMGRGELALLLTYWVLRDMSKCSILVIEEPETHVSPRSQDHLMNVIAKFCDEKAIWVITATHSPTIVRRLPRENIRLLVRGAGTAEMVSAPSWVQVATILSGGVAFKGIFFVEDVGAKSFLLCLLEELAPDLLPQFEVIPAGSDSAITRVLVALPVTSDWLTVIGVYDGGTEETITNTEVTPNWPAVFLPGGRAPELVLKGIFLEDAEFRKTFAGEIRRSEEAVDLAINHVSGVDHHEWVQALATALARDLSLVRQTLLHLWIERNKPEASGFVEELRHAINNIYRERDTVYSD